MVQQITYAESGLDGQDPGGFVVLNVNSPMRNPCQVLEGETGGYYLTLQEAREACERFREESGNEEIYVYAVIGVRQALELHPSDLQLA